MKKYAKIINDKTKEVSVGLGTNIKFYQSIGMKEMDVEQGYNQSWYLAGHTPERTYREKRQSEYPSIPEQLDMLYWDKINNTTLWQDMITAVKTKYPKE